MLARTGVMLVSLMVFVSGMSSGAAGSGALTEEDILWGEIPVVVASTLQEEKSTEVPSPVYVVTAEEIRKKGYYTLKDAAQDVPGFFDVSDANESIVGERGAFASTTNKTLILINGHRMNDLNLGRWNMDQFLGMDAVERIEFIHGPGSALYGTGALFGVINIITKKGSSVGGQYLKAKAGSFNNELSYTYGAVSDNGTDVMVNVTAADSKGDEIDQPAALNNVPAGQTKTDGKVYLNKYPQNFSAMASVRSKDVTLNIRKDHYSRATPRGPNGTYYDWDMEAWPPSYNVDSFFADISADIRLNDRSKIVVNPSIHYYELKEQSWINTYGANLLPPYGSRSGQFTEEIHYRLKAYYQGQVSDALNITAGYDGIYANFPRSMGWSLTDGTNISLSPYYLDKGKLFINGLFAQALYDPTAKLSLVGGVRYDSFDGQADPALTPRFGIICKCNAPLVIKLLYGNSYLAPEWAHQHTYSSATQAFQSNTDLKPEKMDSVDLIASYTGSRMQAWIDLFYNKVDGIITARTVGGVQRYVNSGQAQYKGAETGVKASVVRGVKANASVSYVADAGSDAGFLSNGNLYSTPMFVYRLGVEYSPLENLSLLAWSRSYSQVNAYFPTNNSQVDAWTAVDFAANYRMKNVDLQLKVINVADTAYYVGDNATNRLPLPGYERGYAVSAGYRF